MDKKCSQLVLRFSKLLKFFSLKGSQLSLISFQVSETDPVDGVLLIDKDYLAGRQVSHFVLFAKCFVKCFF